MNECIFCKIISKDIPAHLVYESESLIVFPDIHPHADIHLLIVPKKHIGGMKDLEKTDGELLTEIYKTVNELVQKNKLVEDYYRVVVNGGKSQHVPHLHFHLLGGQWNKMV